MTILSSIRTWRQTVRTLPATHPFNLRFGELAHLVPLILVAGITSLLALAFVGGYFLRWTQHAHADFGLATGMGWDCIHINTSWLAHRDAAHLKANAFALSLAAMGVMALSMTIPPASYPGRDQMRHMLSDLGRCLVSQIVVLLPIAWGCGILNAYVYPSGSYLVGASGVIAGFFGLMAVDLCVRRRITDMRWIVASLIVAAFGAKTLLTDVYLVAHGFQAVDNTSHLGHVLGCAAGVIVSLVHWTTSRWLPTWLQRGNMVLSDKPYAPRQEIAAPDSETA